MDDAFNFRRFFDLPAHVCRSLCRCRAAILSPDGCQFSASRRSAPRTTSTDRDERDAQARRVPALRSIRQNRCANQRTHTLHVARCLCMDDAFDFRRFFDLPAYVCRSLCPCRAAILSPDGCQFHFPLLQLYYIQNIEARAKVKFIRVNVPQQSDMIKSSVATAVKAVKAVSPDVVPYFLDAAKNLLETNKEEGRSTADLLAMALAKIAGFSEAPKKRSLLTSASGMVTVQVNMGGGNEIRSLSFIWGIIRRYIMEDCDEKVRQTDRQTTDEGSCCGAPRWNGNQSSHSAFRSFNFVFFSFSVCVVGEGHSSDRRSSWRRVRRAAGVRVEDQGDRAAGQARLLQRSRRSARAGPARGRTT